MKRSLLASVSILALTGASSAADMPQRSAPMPYKAPAATVVESWTGFYVGINGGAVWHRAKVDASDAVGNFDSSTVNTTGGTFGGQAGFNWQWQHFVAGVEADWNWVNASGTGNFVNFPPNQFTSKLSSLGTVRGRLGVTFSPTMIYVTGGYAFGKVENATPTGLFGGFPTDSKVKSGWTAGGGIEHMFAQHWTAKVEALYVDLGQSSVQGAFGSGYNFNTRNTAVVGRVGLNYKF